MPRPSIWVLEDQLRPDLPTLRMAPHAPVLLIESDHAFRMHPYHKRRLVFLVSAMRHFAEELREAGRDVDHYPLRPRGYRDSVAAIREHLRRTGCDELLVVEPSEHPTRAWIESLPPRVGAPVRLVPTTLFLTDRAEFAAWARPLRSPVMETFYRRMRRRHGVLMDGEAPVGGQWNLDASNRRAPPRGMLVPPPPSCPPDALTRQAMREIERRFPDHPGAAEGFDLPVTRRDAEAWFADFLDQRLPLFGDFEDAMLSGQPLLWHSLISPLLNAGLLDPMACIRAAEQRFRDGRAPLNSVEGFIRQVLGWREYVYGIYWTFMPEYRRRNARGDDAPLPQFFWTGDADLNCLRQTLSGVVERGYSHHIQRLMVLCNFATLAGLSPQAVNDWFLAMYVDSHDWVVTPNVIGMGMHADGGTMASKPYVSSAAYVHRMSDYCGGCRYRHDRRTGEDACPFNYLYWAFLEARRQTLSRNPRMAMALKNLDRIDPAERREMTRLARGFMASLRPGTTG